MASTIEFISGNIFIRPHRLGKGDVIVGHIHQFDHTSIVFTGKVHVSAVLPDGRTVERDFEAPAHFLVRAEVKHEITGLAEDTQFWCVYSHRNPQAQIVQVFDGWGPSYS